MPPVDDDPKYAFTSGQKAVDPARNSIAEIKKIAAADDDAIHVFFLSSFLMAAYLRSRFVQ
jgi:hypothetical protein